VGAYNIVHWVWVRVEFPAEVIQALNGHLDLSALSFLEDEMVGPFLRPDPTKKWREGIEKASFIYLLLDPRVTLNLPVRAKTMGE